MRLTSFSARIGAAQSGGAGCSKQAGRQAEREGGIRSAFESEGSFG
jgi:hypothetical protein